MRYQVLYALALLPAYAWAAEVAVTGGASVSSSYDDNVEVAPINEISLTGFKADGFLELLYATPLLQTTTRLTLGADRYTQVELDSDDPQLKEPGASDFDNERYGVSTDLTYERERHSLYFYAGFLRDSTLNTSFADGALGGRRQIEGATEIDTTIVRPGWRWQLTERQVLDTNLSAQFADYESDLYINYDYYAVQTTWFYVLNELMQLQVRPLASRYENAAAFAITSDTYGLETGIVWLVNEKWKLNVLGGVTQVTSDFGDAGYFIFNPVTGQIEFIEVEEETNNGFTGSGELTFEEEIYGFSMNLLSNYTPSNNGYLQQETQARTNFYWKPQERWRLDLSAQLGETDTSGGQVNNNRTYGEAAIRVGYQFAEQWWVSGRYRYRQQEYERNLLGSANGNTLFAEVSYRLPKEIL